MKKRVFILLMAMVMLMGFNITVMADSIDINYNFAAIDYYDLEDHVIRIPVYFTFEGTPYYEDDDGINAGYSGEETFYLVQVGSKLDVNSSDEIDDTEKLIWIKNADITIPEEITSTIKTEEGPVYLLLNNTGNEEYNGNYYPLAAYVEYETGEAQTDLAVSGYAEEISGDMFKYYNIYLPDYDASGTYTYELQQVIGTTMGVTYFGNLITLTVTTNEGGSVTGVTMNAGGVYNEDDGCYEPYVGIDNTYSTGSLTIKKEVTGSLGDTSGFTEFTVTVKMKVPVNLDWNGTILKTTYALSDAKTDLKNSGLYEEPEEELVYLKLSNAIKAEIIDLGDPTDIDPAEYDSDAGVIYNKMFTYSFTITANGIVTLWNLPEGINYEVTETGTNGYTVTYSLSDTDYEHYQKYTSDEVHEDFWGEYKADNKWGSYLKGLIEWDSDQDIIIIGNSMDGDWPTTGISLDSLPYILMLIAAAAGFVILLSGKRLRNRG